MKIIDIEAIQILDSRGNPTLQVSVTLDDGSKGTFSVPSGASTGAHEAHELRDGNANLYNGKSVLKAVENANKVAKQLVNHDFTQQSLDQQLITLDGTDDKSILGANTILGISVAFAKASAKFYNLHLNEYLYRLLNNVTMTNKTDSELQEIHLFVNIINGGVHAGNRLQPQEFMIVPNLSTMQSNVRAASEIYHALKQIIEKKYGKSNTAVGDEGGFAPDISTPEEALDLLNEAIKRANYEEDVFMALDPAASEFYNESTKKYEIEIEKELTSDQLIDYYNSLVERYPIISIEDPLAEDDFEGFESLMKKKIQLKFENPLTKNKDLLIVGDDLLVTNPQRIKIAQEKKLCNALLLKINQIGTLTESIESHNLAKAAKWHTVVSHRSGETTDDFIADLAAAMSSSIKLGAPCRGERVAKFNKLLNIYNER